MRKIVGFKLEVRRSAVERRAKKFVAGLAEGELDNFLSKAYGAMKPAVVFDSYSKPLAEESAVLSPLPGLGFSLILASLGESFAAFRDQAREGQELIYIVEEIALEDAGRFAASLIEQEAAQEACELSPLSLLSGDALAMAFKKLPGDKISMGLEEGRLKPSCSRAWSLSWMAKSKSRGKAK